MPPYSHKTTLPSFTQPIFLALKKHPPSKPERFRDRLYTVIPPRSLASPYQPQRLFLSRVCRQHGPRGDHDRVRATETQARTHIDNSRVDNSESSRNGDYIPSRWEAQQDAVNLIFTAKTNSNPESAVGLMSMGGKGPEVLVTLTTNFGQILEGMHRTKIGGHAHLATGIQIAALALKHRQNKMQRQRIIVFSCSPIREDEKELVKLAKKMKKNAINVDFIAFGDLEGADGKKLEAFNENVKGGDGSTLATIPPGPNLLSDSITNTAILGGGDTQMGGATSEAAPGATDNSGFDFDPNTDPELALALRMSMEEDNARKERERKAKDTDKMEGIPEEGGESQPLLDKDGTPSGDKKDKKDDDKMDTA